MGSNNDECWMIVSFLEIHEHRVVPKKWITQLYDDNDCPTFYSLWPAPHIKVTNDILRKCINPSSEWQRYKIKILDNGKEYNNFYKAWHRQIDITTEASSAVAEKLTIKKIKKTSSLVQDVSENSNASEEVMNIFKTYQNEVQKTCTSANTYIFYTKSQNSNKKSLSKKNNILSCNSSNNVVTENLNIIKNKDLCICDSNRNNKSETDVLYQQVPIKLESNDDESYLQGDLPTVLSNYNISPIQNDQSIKDEVQPVQENNIFDHTPCPTDDFVRCLNTSQTFNSCSNHQERNTHIVFMELLAKIYKEQIKNRLLLQCLVKKFDSIEEIIKINRFGLVNTSDLKSEFLTNWPLKDQTMFRKIESLLVTNDLFVSIVERFFNSIGGNSLKENLKRILTKIFSKEFATKCSWTGRGKDISVKLHNTKIVMLLKKCMRNNQKDYTEPLFESVFAHWFRLTRLQMKRSHS